LEIVVPVEGGKGGEIEDHGRGDWFAIFGVRVRF
jgi:hypothetical protein